MNIKLIMFFGLFILIYGSIHYYIGLRGWQCFQGLFSNPRIIWYWIIFIAFLASSYPLARFLAPRLPYETARMVIFIGSYWLAFMYYLLIILLAIDIVRIIDRWAGFLPAILKNTPAMTGLAVMLAVAVLVIYGTWNANHPVIRDYEVTLNKKSSDLETLHVVAVSDIHLGWINGLKQMKILTDMINELNPDLVLLTGDIIDEGIDLAAEQKIPQVLRTLHPHLGIYAIMGNHEYISKNADQAEAYLNRAGVVVLRDQWIKIGNSLYLIGRDDQSRVYYGGTTRLALSEIMKGMEKDHLPVLLMDHQPVDLENAEQAGIDLQISGHTHRGQLWPNNYITRTVFEQDCGYLRKGHLQLIVSCGYGTWGPPIRIGNRPEILNIRIKFEPSAISEITGN
ncbi:MAG: metallophosphoesterase [Syntrophomonadaceae bacterium]|jgi:predicted MPP superfamily phosphohydrolase